MLFCALLGFFRRICRVRCECLPFRTDRDLLRAGGGVGSIALGVDAMKNQLQIVYLSPAELKPYEKNTRKHSPTDIEQIKASIEADGFNDPIGIWSDDNIIIEGHGRQIAAIEMGLKTVPCIRLDHLTDTQRRDYAIRHNRTAELSAWDFATLEEEIARLQIEGVDLSGLAFDFGNDTEKPVEAEFSVEEEQKGSLADKYLVPPFSVIYANKPDWLARKRRWVDFGIRSELGRGGD